MQLAALLERHRTLVALLIGFLVLHALYNWAIPLGEGPDEPGHLAYSLFLAREHRLPVQQAPPAASDVPGEGHQPPLAYLLALPAVAWLPPAQQQILLTANPRFVWSGGDEPGAFMRGSQERWPWTGLTLGWHLARGISGLWGAATVLCTYLAARRLAPDTPRLAPLAAALVAFNPQFLFSSALVSNDALLAALGAALLCWCLAAVQPGGWGTRAIGWAVGAGLLFGLALLTKQSALLFGPLLLWGGWHAAGAQPARRVAVTLTWGLTALAVAGWWFARNRLLYGDLFGLAAFKAEFATQPFAWHDPAAWHGALRQLFGSFWARFGWMSLHPPAWTLWVYAALSALAALGWLQRAASPGPRRVQGRPGTSYASPTLARQNGTASGVSSPSSASKRGGHGVRASRAAPSSISRIRLETLHSPGQGWGGPLIALGMAGAWTLAFALTAGLVAWQGRMLFPAISAIGLLLAAGLLALGTVGPLASLARRPLAVALMLGLLALATLMPLGVIRPAYPWVALAPREAQAHLGNPLYARYAASWEQGVVLRGWRLEATPQPGITLPVTLTWNSLEPVPHSWTVFVHLVDTAESIVAESNSRPQGDELPFTLWTPGDWMADTHSLALPANLAPGAYRLRVGLYSPEQGGRRQQVWDNDGHLLGDVVELGVVEVEP